MFGVSAQHDSQKYLLIYLQDPAAYLDPAHLPGEAEVGLKGAGGSKRGSLGGSSDQEGPPWRGGEPGSTTDQYYAAQYDQYYRSASHLTSSYKCLYGKVIGELG